ncbi:MAG: hypothetical protein R3D60_05525 [Paracoccaceae bacterium]
MTTMASFTSLMNGAHPRFLSLALTYGLGGLAALIVWAAGPGGLSGVVLAVFALDWVGGVVSNSAAATRDTWAELPRWTFFAFLGVHAAEIPVLWLLAPPALFWPLLGILMLKMAVFIIGNNDLRKDLSS